MASTHAAKNGWKPRRRRHASRVWGKWGWGANELARSGDAGVGALCRCAHASGLRSRHPSTCTVTPALALHIHHSIHHHRPSSSVTSHQTYLVTSHRTPCESRVHSVLVEKGSLPRISTSRSRDVGSDHIFSSPPSIPYSSASSASVAAPCTDAWVSRLLPTLGRPGGPFSFVN